MCSIISFHTHQNNQSNDQCFNSRTVLVAGLSERLPLGENDGHGQILEGGDVEEGGVLVVLDVFVVVRARHIHALRGTGVGNVAGTAGGERREAGIIKNKINE